MDKHKKCIQFLENSQYDELEYFLIENMDATDAELWNFRGIAKSSKGELELANDYFKKPVEYSTNNIHHFLNFFTSCFAIGKGNYALKQLEKLAPGLDNKQVCNLIVPNIYEAICACDISLIDIPKSIYKFMIDNQPPIDYILDNYDKVKEQILTEISGIQREDDLIYLTLKMDIEKRLEIIKLIMSMGIVYSNNDLTSMDLNKINPENDNFEKLVLASSQFSIDIFSTYTLKEESTESMIERVLPHPHMFGLFKSLVIISIAQRFDITMSQIYSSQSNDTELEQEQEFLIDMLSFDLCESIDDVISHADLIASNLINNWKIVTKNGEHRFLSLEFYLNIPEILNDSSVHCRDEQLNSGTFYFHTKSKFPNWSPPIFNRHGLDITCGSRENNIFGGILIRHISGVNSQDGSGRALRGIMRGDSGFNTVKRGSPESNWSDTEKDLFKKINNQSIFNDEIKVVYDPIEPKLNIKSSQRVGIEKTSHNELKLRFICELAEEYKKAA